MSKISPIKVPQWGLEMTEGALSAWHVSPGDRIRKGAEIADIETAKIVNTLESGHDLPGVVRRLVASIGDTLPVGALIAVAAEESVSEAEIDQFVAEMTGAVLAQADLPVAEAQQAPVATQAEVGGSADEHESTSENAEPTASQRPERSAQEFERIAATNAEVKASPVARRIANRLGIELGVLEGTGRNGRVSVDDLVRKANVAAEDLAAKPLPPALSAERLAKINGGLNVSPVALRLASQHGIDLRAVKGTGRHGRISVADLEALLPRTQPQCLERAEQESEILPAGSFRAGPAARKLAAELGFDLSALEASGPRNVVLKDDVRNAFKSILEGMGGSTSALQDFELVPMTPMRKAIASSLVESKQTVPHFYLTVDLCMDALMAVRDKMNGHLPPGQKKLSFNDFIMRATALALMQVPDANVHYSTEGIKRFNSVHLCLAVAIDGGLMTPVIRNAETKGLFAIASEAVSLAEQARDRSLRMEQLSGGTFTVSNLGMYGIRQFDAVINPPQGGILAVGSMRREACEGEDGSVKFRSMMSVTMSCDHRVIDGAVGARFLAALRERIENPYSLMG